MQKIISIFADICLYKLLLYSLTISLWCANMEIEMCVYVCVKAILTQQDQSRLRTNVFSP